MKKLIVSTVASWLPLSAATVCIFGFMFYVMQQYIRLSANEIPAQYANDIVEKLKTGMSPTQTIGGIVPIDMQKSLSPFVMILDGNCKYLSGTAMLNGTYPAPPLGALTFAKQQGENRITWQPERGVRTATVIIPYNVAMPDRTIQEGYVVAGRLMRETEQRERFLNMQIFAGIIITLIATFITMFLVHYIKHRLRINSVQ